MHYIKKSIIATLFMGFSLSAYAVKPVQPVIQGCELIDVQVATVKLLDGSGVTTLPVPKDATDCLGAFAGNNSSFSKPVANLGYDEDGWLNKENYNGWWTGPGAFVGEADLLNLDGGAVADDPGWIYVAESNNSGVMIGQTSTGVSSSYPFVNDLITFNNCKDKDGISSTCIGGDAVSGDWVYTPPTQNPDELINLLGGDFFDQIAIIFKAGDAFAMYNFSLADFGLDPVLAGDFNYSFTGTWDITDTLAAKGLSNVSLWIRDPFDTTVVVPEPSSLALFLLSGLCLFCSKKLKQ